MVCISSVRVLHEPITAGRAWKSSFSRKPLTWDLTPNSYCTYIVLGEKNPFFPPLPTFNLGICSEGLIDWFLIYLSPLWLWYESTLSRCPEQMPSIYFLFFRRTENNVFWPTGWEGWAKILFLSPEWYRQVIITCCIPSNSLFAARDSSGFPDITEDIFLSSLLILRQCFPLQIKYISFAVRKPLTWDLTPNSYCT